VTGSGRRPLLPDLAGTPLPLREDGSPSQDPADIVDAIDARVRAELATTTGAAQGSSERPARVEPPPSPEPSPLDCGRVTPVDRSPSPDRVTGGR